MEEYTLENVRDASGVQIKTLINVNGMIISYGPSTAEQSALTLNSVKDLEIRHDDIMLCTPIKSGTHWVFEIIQMMLSNKAAITDTQKGFLMLPAMPIEYVNSQPSPRVLNSHLPISQLPTGLRDKRTKLVVVLRNPKDVAVSYYYHVKGFAPLEYDGKFSDFLPVFVRGQIEFNSWFDYVREIEQAIAAVPDRFHLMYYEDLIEDGLHEIVKLARFLHVKAADDIELCRQIQLKCSFNSYKKGKHVPKEFGDITKDDFNIARKGVIGDWKNHFTVAESETFDKVFAEKMKGSKLKFRFQPTV